MNASQPRLFHAQEMVYAETLLAVTLASVSPDSLATIVKHLWIPVQVFTVKITVHVWSCIQRQDVVVLPRGPESLVKLISMNARTLKCAIEQGFVKTQTVPSTAIVTEVGLVQAVRRMLTNACQRSVRTMVYVLTHVEATNVRVKPDGLV